MATGSLTDCPWLFQKIIRPLGLQALQALGRLPWPATPEADSRKATQPQRPPPRTTTGWPTPGSRLRKDRLPKAGHEERRVPRAGHEERRLQEAGQDRTHQNYTHITVTRWGVAIVRPTTPKPEVGMATGRRTGRASPVRLGTVAMLASTSSMTDSRTAHGRRAPSARERREGGPAFPSRPRV